ncbi:MAG: hypothetical protein ACOC5T_00530 [Elusimicrobiota bacterium]
MDDDRFHVEEDGYICGVVSREDVLDVARDKGLTKDDLTDKFMEELADEIHDRICEDGVFWDTIEFFIKERSEE